MRSHPLRVLAVSSILMVTLVAGASAGKGGWSRVGSGATQGAPALNGQVYALNSDNPGVLYAGGAFTSASGNSRVARIAKWQGGRWNAVGSPTLNGDVHAIAYHAGKVYVGGQFTNAGGDPKADFLAVWDGTSWKPPCNAPGTGSAITASVQALQVIGSTLYVGGSFGNGAGIAAADFLLACDLNTGAPHATVPHDGDINSGVNALTADRNGVLYAAGAFINVTGIAAADHVAYYSGGSWHAMGSGPPPGGGALSSIARSLTADGTDVYVGTDSTDIAGIPTADFVARWDGSRWQAIGSNSERVNGWFPPSTTIYAIKAFGLGRLVAAGSFANANGDPLADNIALIDARTRRWGPLGSNGAGNGPFNGNVLALATFGLTIGTNHLFAGGNFTNVGGDPQASYVASYPVPRG